MEVDKFKEDFFVEIPFKSLFIEPLPNESVLHRERFDIAESRDTSDSSKVFIDVRAIIATVDKGFVQFSRPQVYSGNSVDPPLQS